MPDIYVSPSHRSSSDSELVDIEKEKKQSPSPLRELFSSFLARPVGVRFESQEKEEEVLLLLRRHFATNIAWIVTTLLLIVAPFFIIPIVAALDILPQSIPISYPFVLLIFWYVGAFGFLLANFMLWYFNIYIITNRRAIDIDFVALLYRQFSATSLRNIEDITSKQGGIFSSIFNYGDVFIQTAGAEPNFDFNAVPQPNKLVRAIWQLAGKYSRASRRPR